MRLIDADALVEKMVQIPLRQWNTRTFGEALDSLPTQPTVNTWVSVKDRLPDEGIYVLVWESQGFTYCDKLVHGIWKIGASYGGIIEYWMPLPEPPQEGKQP